MRDTVSGPDRLPASSPRSPSPPTDSGCLQVLALSCEPVQALLAARHPQAHIVHTRWAHLNARLLADVLPGAVAAPLFGEGFDAVDLAARLQRLGYRGALWVVTPALPSPAMVRREIAAAGKGLEVTLYRRD